MLGPIKFRQQGVAAESEIGLATGLAWTEIGGEVLQIEATLTKGRGGVMLTGKLGDVMQESAQAALTCIKARAERLGNESRHHPQARPSHSHSRRRDS